MEEVEEIINIANMPYWLIDGNYFSKNRYQTFDFAKQMAKTLRNCFNCIDC